MPQFRYLGLLDHQLLAEKVLGRVAPARTPAGPPDDFLGRMQAPAGGSLRKGKATKLRRRPRFGNVLRSRRMVPSKLPEDPINPSHYKGDLVMRIIEKFKLGFRLGNAGKYILRHGEKAGLEDLKKARWYIDREIADLDGSLKTGVVE